jgi:hypothetical protein
MINGFVPSKYILSLRDLKDPEAVHQAQLVHTNISQNELFHHLWPDSAVKLDELGGSIVTTRDAMVAAATKDQLKLAFLGTCRYKLDFNYYYVGRYAEIVTRSDPATMGALGYGVAQPTTHKGPPPVQQLSGIKLKHGGEGVIIAEVPAVPGLKTIEAQFTTGDPTVESNFGLSCIFVDRKHVVFQKLTPGLLHAFRFRGIFIQGTGPWSAIITIRTI